MNGVKAALKTVREVIGSHEKLFGAAITRNDETIAASMPALRAVFGASVHHLERAKRSRNALDFDDLEYGALRVLECHPEVLERWRRDIHAVLVDEYQDTNRRQGDFVRRLAGADGKLFIVGDAKQSIYRFRGADVTVFRSERDRIAASGGSVLTLVDSYRTHPDLLHALDALLAPVLGTLSQPDRPWVERFEALKAARTAPADGLSSPFVELLLTVGTRGEDALDRAADAVVARVREARRLEGGHGGRRRRHTRSSSGIRGRRHPLPGIDIVRPV